MPEMPLPLGEFGVFFEEIDIQKVRGRTWADCLGGWTRWEWKGKGLARGAPDQPDGIEPEARLLEELGEFLAMVGEVLDLGGRDVAIALGEVLQARDFGG